MASNYRFNWPDSNAEPSAPVTHQPQSVFQRSNPSDVSSSLPSTAHAQSENNIRSQMPYYPPPTLHRAPLSCPPLSPALANMIPPVCLYTPTSPREGSPAYVTIVSGDNAVLNLGGQSRGRTTQSYTEASRCEEAQVFRLQPPPKDRRKGRVSSELTDQSETSAVSNSSRTNSQSQTSYLPTPSTNHQSQASSRTTLSNNNQPQQVFQAPSEYPVNKRQVAASSSSQNNGNGRLIKPVLLGSKRTSSDMQPFSDWTKPIMPLEQSPKKLRSENGPIPSPVKKSPSAIHGRHLSEYSHTSPFRPSTETNQSPHSHTIKDVRRSLSFFDTPYVDQSSAASNKGVSAAHCVEGHERSNSYFIPNARNQNYLPMENMPITRPARQQEVSGDDHEIITCAKGPQPLKSRKDPAVRTATDTNQESIPARSTSSLVSTPDATLRRANPTPVFGIEAATITNEGSYLPRATNIEPPASELSLETKQNMLAPKTKRRSNEPEYFVFPNSVADNSDKQDEVDGFDTPMDIESEHPGYDGHTQYHSRSHKQVGLSPHHHFSFGANGGNIQTFRQSPHTHRAHSEMPGITRTDSWGGTRFTSEPRASHPDVPKFGSSIPGHQINPYETDWKSFSFKNSSQERLQLDRNIRTSLTDRGNAREMPNKWSVEAAKSGHTSQPRFQYWRSDVLDSGSFRPQVTSSDFTSERRVPGRETMPSTDGNQRRGFVVGNEEVLDTSEPDYVIHTSDCKNNVTPSYDANSGFMFKKADTNATLIHPDELSGSSMSCEDSFGDKSADDFDDDDDYQNNFGHRKSYSAVPDSRHRYRCGDETDGASNTRSKVTLKSPNSSSKVSSKPRHCDKSEAISSEFGKLPTGSDENRLSNTMNQSIGNRTPDRNFPHFEYDNPHNQRQNYPYEAWGFSYPPRNPQSSEYTENTLARPRPADQHSQSRSPNRSIDTNVASHCSIPPKERISCSMSGNQQSYQDDEVDEDSSDEVDGLGDDKKKANVPGRKFGKRDNVGSEDDDVVHVFDDKNEEDKDEPAGRGSIRTPQTVQVRQQQEQRQSEERKQQPIEKPPILHPESSSFTHFDDQPVGVSGAWNKDTRRVEKGQQLLRHQPISAKTSRVRNVSPGATQNPRMPQKQRSNSDAAITDLPSTTLPRARSSPSKLEATGEGHDQTPKFHRPWQQSPTIKNKSPSPKKQTQRDLAVFDPGCSRTVSDQNLTGPTSSTTEATGHFSDPSFNVGIGFPTDRRPSEIVEKMSRQHGGSSLPLPSPDPKWNKRRSEGDLSSSILGASGISCVNPRPPPEHGDIQKQREKNPKRRLEFQSSQMRDDMSQNERYEMRKTTSHRQERTPFDQSHRNPEGYGRSHAGDSYSNESCGMFSYGQPEFTNISGRTEGAACGRSENEVDIRVSVTDIMAETWELGQKLETIYQTNDGNCECARIEKEMLTMGLEMYRRLGSDPMGFPDWHTEVMHTNAVMRNSLEMAKMYRELCRHGRQVTNVLPGSVIIRVKCRSLTSVVDLCDLHASGDLHLILYHLLAWDLIDGRRLTLGVSLDQLSVRTCTEFMLRKLSTKGDFIKAAKNPRTRKMSPRQRVKSTENLLHSPPASPSPRSYPPTRSTSTPALNQYSPLNSPRTGSSGMTFIRGRERKGSLSEKSRIAFQELNISDTEPSRSPSKISSTPEEFPASGMKPDVTKFLALSLNSPSHLTSPTVSPLPSPRRGKRCDVIPEQENIQHEDT